MRSTSSTHVTINQPTSSTVIPRSAKAKIQPWARTHLPINDVEALAIFPFPSCPQSRCRRILSCFSQNLILKASAFPVTNYSLYISSSLIGVPLISAVSTACWILDGWVHAASEVWEFTRSLGTTNLWHVCLFSFAMKLDHLPRAVKLKTPWIFTYFSPPPRPMA